MRFIFFTSAISSFEKTDSRKRCEEYSTGFNTSWEKFSEIICHPEIRETVAPLSFYQNAVA